MTRGNRQLREANIAYRKWRAREGGEKEEIIALAEVQLTWEEEEKKQGRQLKDRRKGADMACKSR